METRAGGAGTDDTRVQTAIRCPTERGPRNEEDLELFQERTLKASLMLRYAGRAADAPFSKHYNQEIKLFIYCILQYREFLVEVFL